MGEQPEHQALSLLGRGMGWFVQHMLTRLALSLMLPPLLVGYFMLVMWIDDDLFPFSVFLAAPLFVGAYKLLSRLGDAWMEKQREARATEAVQSEADRVREQVELRRQELQQRLARRRAAQGAAAAAIKPGE